jgi:hypothetical protein
MNAAAASPNQGLPKSVQVALVVLAAAGFPLGLGIIYLTWWNAWSWVGTAMVAFSPMTAAMLANRFFQRTKMRPAALRYGRRCAVVMVVYFLALMGSVAAYNTGITEGFLGYVIAVAPALPIIGVFVILGRLFKEETDEFVRMLMLRALVWAGALTFAEATVWGFLETFGKVPNLWMWVAPIAFFAQLGITTPLMIRRYR